MWALMEAQLNTVILRLSGSCIVPRRDAPGSGLWPQHCRFGVGRPCRVVFDAAGVPALTIFSDALLSALGLVAAAATGEGLIITSGRIEHLAYYEPTTFFVCPRG